MLISLILLLGILSILALLFLYCMIYDKIYNYLTSKKNKAVIKKFNEVKACPQAPKDTGGNFQVYILKPDLVDMVFWISGPVPFRHGNPIFSIETYYGVTLSDTFINLVSAYTLHALGMEPRYELRNLKDNMWLGEVKASDYGKTWKVRYWV